MALLIHDIPRALALAAFFVALAVLSSAVVGIMHELLFRENIVSIAQLTLAAGGRPPPSHRGS